MSYEQNVEKFYSKIIPREQKINTNYLFEVISNLQRNKKQVLVLLKYRIQSFCISQLLARLLTLDQTCRRQQHFPTLSLSVAQKYQSLE